MLSKRLTDKFVESFSLNVGHYKKDFNRDYKDFVLAHDELSMLADKAKSEGSLDNFLAYVDDGVTALCKDAVSNRNHLSKAIERAYILEDLKAKFDGNKSFGDVAYAVYNKFEGKIAPEDFVGSCVYIELFTGKNFEAALSDKMTDVDFEKCRLLDSPELEEQPYAAYRESDYYYLSKYYEAADSRYFVFDKIDYVDEISDFVSKFHCGEFASDTVKSHFREQLDSYFNSVVSSSANMKPLYYFVLGMYNNRIRLTDMCDSHVVESVVRDKLDDVAQNISNMSCNSKVNNYDENYVVAGFGLERLQRVFVGKYAGYRVANSFFNNDNISDSVKADAYDNLKQFMSYKERDKFGKKFGDYELDNASLIDFENGFNEYGSYKNLIRYADLYKTSKVLNSDIQRVISDGVDAGLSNKALKSKLASYEKPLRRITYYFGTKVQGFGVACDAFADGMDNSSAIDVYKSASKKFDKEISGTPTERDKYIRKSLDKHLIYKSFMSGRLHGLTFGTCVQMKDVAQDFNVLSSKFGMSFDSSHLCDLVDTFNTGLVIDSDFEPYLKVKEKPLPKRKVLKQVESKALSDEASYDV